MLQIIFFITNILLISGLGVVAFYLYKQSAAKKAQEEQTSMDSFRKEIQTNLSTSSESLRVEFRHFQDQFTKQLQNQSQVLQTTNTDLNKRMDRAAQVISDVHRELGKMSNVARSIDDLQNILKAPKLRGGFGELFLNDLLQQILPNEHFDTQYKFKNGEMVDAVIYLGDKFVPVDSKFPLENFQKITSNKEEEVPKNIKRQFINDVKRHIQAVAKYIRMDENTYDFALMYIPAENIYYEIAVKEDFGGEERELLNYALKHKVIPVSPNTLYAYLMTIIVGLKGMQIEKHAEAMLIKMGRVNKDLGNFQRVFSKLGTHLENARKSYEDADKRLTKVDGKLQEFEVQKTSEIEAPVINESEMTASHPPA